MRPAALLPLLALAGCKGLPDVCDDYSNRTCIALQIELASNGPTAIDEVVIAPVSGLTLSQGATHLSVPRGTEAPFPLLAPVLPASLSGAPVVIDVQGLLNGGIVGDASFTEQIRNGDHDHVTVSLARPNDMGVAYDMAGGGGGGGGGGGSGGGMCDPVAQTGCTSSEKCDIPSKTATNTVCVANGTVATNATCTVYPNDDCVRGDACYPPTTGISWCIHMCRATSDCPSGSTPVSTSNVPHCCTSTSECSAYATAYQAGPVTGCSTPCNPVLAFGASGCASGGKCDVETLDSGAEFTSCYLHGSGGDGYNCQSNVDCMDGYGCFGTTGMQHHCRLFCRKGNNADCTIANQTCLNISNGGTGWTFIGGCCPAAGC